MNIEGEGPVTVEDFFTSEAADPESELPGLEEGLDDLPEEPALEGDEAEADPEVIEDEAEEEEAPATPMPTSWSKEDAKAWAALTPEAQSVVVRREAERDKFVRETGRKAAETRHTVENEARQVLARQAEAHAAALTVYAQQFQANPPDQSLLYTGNPDDVLVYHRQDAAYRAAAAQQHQLQQAVAQAQQQALEVRSQANSQDLAVDAERLKEQLPEWFDTSSGPKLKQELQSIGSELGYPVELMAEASSVDILALKKAADWKAKADKFDKLVSKRMETVRAAKGLPKMARPGATPGRGAQAAQASSRRTDALQSFGETRSGSAAAALLLERKR
jgi:hypothetical protein